MTLVTAFVTALHTALLTTYATHNVARPEPEPEPDPFLSLTSGLWLPLKNCVPSLRYGTPRIPANAQLPATNRPTQVRYSTTDRARGVGVRRPR